MGQFAAHADSGHETGAPGSLEVESSGYGVHVQDFTCKIQARALFAFKSIEIYRLQRHTSAGYEFLAVAGFATDTAWPGQQCLYQTVNALATELGPGSFERDSALQEQILPEPLGYPLGMQPPDVLLRISLQEGRELAAQRRFVAGKPSYCKRAAV